MRPTFWDTPCKILCCPCWLPILLMRSYESMKDRWKDHKMDKEYRKHAFPDLAKRKRRRRALTGRLDEPVGIFSKTTKQGAFLQEQSLLFNRLPTELRLQIWESVLGGHSIKIESWSPWQDSPKRPKNWWALVCTCRIAYSETITLLYTTTHFTLLSNHSYTLLSKFRSSILSQRWNSIRYLTLHYNLDPLYHATRQGCVISQYWEGEVLGSEEWPELCKVLGTMEGLKECRVKVRDDTHWLNAESLGMLRCVSASDVFEVEVGWEETEEIRGMVKGGVPFRIITTPKTKHVMNG